MARKLKTYQTSLGFFDLAVAAPSMKAALEAWGADSNLFHQGAAMQSEDPDIIEATMAAPGVVLKRPSALACHSRSTPSCLPTSPATVRRRQAGSLQAANRRSLQSAATTRRPAERPHSLSRSSKSAASANAPRKRPPDRRSASDVSIPSTRRKVHSMRPVGSMKTSLRIFNNSSRLLRRRRGPKKRVGKRKRSAWKPHCNVREVRVSKRTLKTKHLDSQR
jgi:hypothetical protein